MATRCTILIIDDEISIRQSLASFFEDEGYHVLTAENGQLGLEKLGANQVDIVLTDLRMPEKDGLDVMEAVQESDPDLPMVVISGAGKKEDIIEAMRMGARDYITKPVEDLNTISRVIQRVLENARLNRENKAYRRQLEKSEAKYRSITENIAEGVFTADENENLTYVNQAACDILGYSKSVLLQKNLEDITDMENFNTILSQTYLRQKGQTSRYEIKLRHHDGHMVHTEFLCSPMFDGTTYKGAIALIRDISRQVALREKYKIFLKNKKQGTTHLVPICASCKNIRTQEQQWVSVEKYFSEALFSHSICPDCFEKLYPGYDLNDLEDEPETG